MAGKTTQAALVGATTLLGKELAAEISQSAAGAWDLRLLDASEEAEGQLTSAGDEALVIQRLDENSLGGADVVFFAGPPEITASYAERAIGTGAAVVDLTGELACRPGFIVRSPWLEDSPRPDLTTVGVTPPHPAALMLALLAERLRRRFALEAVVATVMEPASQAGVAGLEELHKQTVGLLSFQEVPKEVFGTQVAFNLQGALGEDAPVSLADTEARIHRDLTYLFGGSFGGALSLQLLQAPVFHSYVISAWIRLQSNATEEEVASALRGGVVVADAETFPSNQAAIESGDVLVRVRRDADQGQSFWVLMAADNLRLSARNAVEAALELAALRPAPRVQ